MSQVYVVQNGSDTIPMQRVRCANEDMELQQLLENNPQLMPGEQIRPEDPRRWMLIKREMPVPDPSTGENRWSIDHFFVDQSATPTFVECKRFMDTRSRREVVGQMLDYAANGQFYWDKSQMRDYAEGAAKERGLDLDGALRQLGSDTESTDEFFETIENNLREGQVRLVFFMEEAPQELKSVVDFLNKQMERSEILIVEAKQFEMDGMRVVAPALFGYTEEARRVKRTVKVTTGTARSKWDEESFFKEVQEKQTEAVISASGKLLDFIHEQGCEVRWGSGKVDGSFSMVGTGLLQKSLFNLYTNGALYFPFGGMVGNVNIENFRDELIQSLVDRLVLRLPENPQAKYPSLKFEEWGPHVDEIIQTLMGLLEKYKS